MKLLVGLGNPGSKYARNRHNVGFMAVDAIRDHHSLGPWRRRFQGLASDGDIDGERVLLLKPETFMNDSGQAVGEAARFLKIQPADVIVLHDELDILPGKLKIKTGGGNAGHNGLRSTSAHIGNEYVRLRIGIGHPGNKDAVIHYVLGDFAKADQQWLDDTLDAMARAAGFLAKGDAAKFLNAVALRLGDPQAAVPTAAAKPDTKATKPARHPAGERASKSQNAIAENLKKWLASKTGKDTTGEGT
jgi:peptidyl-tRNA hydrolase, PTH1 family